VVIREITLKSKLDFIYFFLLEILRGRKPEKIFYMLTELLVTNIFIKIVQPPFERINIVHDVPFSEDFHRNFLLRVKSS